MGFNFCRKEKEPLHVEPLINPYPTELEEKKNDTQTEQLIKIIERQEKMLKLLILNTKTLITSLSSHIDDKNLIHQIQELLDQQDKLINDNYL